jgi:thiamine kinase-like enzyme
MTTEVEIPEEPAALTADWLREALGWPVSSVRQEILGQGQGFLGDIVRLHLELDDQAGANGSELPATVIAKIPKKVNRHMGEMLGVYEREVMFFESFATRIPSRIPEIYFSHYDPDAGSAKQKEILAALDRLPRFLTPAIGFVGKKVAAAKNRRYLVIMEDLAQFQPGDQYEGASAEDCAAVLEQFAATHRAFWQAPGLDDHFWLLPLDIDARMREGMFRQVRDVFLEEAGDELAPYIHWLADHSAELNHTFVREAPATLIHCDLRLDNVCFNGADCAYLDWQLTRSGPAAYDVAYFLGSALDADATADEEEAILRRYHRALDAPDYPFETFLRDYHRGLMATLASVMPSDDFAIDEGRGQTMMSRWRARHAALLTRVDVDTLL